MIFLIPVRKIRKIHLRRQSAGAALTVPAELSFKNQTYNQKSKIPMVAMVAIS